MQWISDFGQGRYFARALGWKIGQEATLFYNDSAKFEARWVHLKVESRCVWTKGMSAQIYLPVAHGEGKFIPRDKKVLDALDQQRADCFSLLHS